MSSDEAGTEDLSVEAVAELLVSGLADLSSRAGAHELTRLSDDELLALTAHLERASRRIQAMLVLAGGAVHDRSLGVPSESLAGKRGCRDGLELLQEVSLLPRTVLRERVVLADLTRPMNGYSAGEIPPRFPAVAEALYAGDLPVESARLIVQMLGRLPGWVDAGRLSDAERQIVNQAAGYPESHEPGAPDPGSSGSGGGLPLDTDTVREVCAAWCTALDQDGPEPDDETNLSRRYFKLGRTWKGLVPVKGALLPEVAALVGNLISSVNSPKSSTNQNDPHLAPKPRAEGEAATGANGGVLGGVRFVPSDQGEAPGAAAGVAVSARPPVDSAVVSNMLGGTANHSAQSHGEDLNEDLGEEPIGDLRSSGQKMHDALMVIAQIAVKAAELPNLGGAPVTVMIQTTQQELAAGLARDVAAAESVARETAAAEAAVAAVAAEATEAAKSAEAAGAGDETQTDGAPDRTWRSTRTTNVNGVVWSRGVPEPEPRDKPEPVGVAWLHGHDGLPVSVSFATVRHSICAGATQRVIVNENGRILGIESPTRIFTPHQRRAIAVRDGGCVIPGCTVPATWCEVHHVVDWSQGGATSTDNGVLLCWWHHRSIEVSGWQIRMIDGVPEVRAPRWIEPRPRWRAVRPLLAGVMSEVAALGRSSASTTVAAPTPVAASTPVAEACQVARADTAAEQGSAVEQQAQQRRSA